MHPLRLFQQFLAYVRRLQRSSKFQAVPKYARCCAGERSPFRSSVERYEISSFGPGPLPSTQALSVGFLITPATVERKAFADLFRLWRGRRLCRLLRGPRAGWRTGRRRAAGAFPLSGVLGRASAFPLLSSRGAERACRGAEAPASLPVVEGQLWDGQAP